MGFYTNVSLKGNRVLYRGYRKGTRVQESVEYNPTLFVPLRSHAGARGHAHASAPTHAGAHAPAREYTTLEGKVVEPFQPGSIKECRDFIRDYEGVDGFEIYGNTDYVYQFIGDLFPEEIEYDPALIRIAYLDIETTCENGFPDIDRPVEEVTVITLKVGSKTHVFGLHDYTISDPNAICHVFSDEGDLLKKFIEVWRELDPDIVTGWNVKFFDIAYLYARTRSILGEKEANRLSPWNMVREHIVHTQHGEKTAFDVIGVAILDYLDLYKTFTYVNQESYKLDHIAHVELGERKISYNEYDSISDFYKKDFSKFVEYNYQDTILIEKLENKMKLLELALALAYAAKVNFVDVFSQVRTWDQIIYHHLRSKNIVIPMKRSGSKNTQYAGAYVKEPITGQHDWIVSFDLNSLYPHLIMQYNISPETKITLTEEESFGMATIMHDILNGKTSDKLNRLTELGSVAANGTVYRKDIQGFLPELMEKMYQERKMYKKLMIEAQKKKERDPTNKQLDFEISKYNNFQLVRKIQLNSAYGAIGNQYFRYYDVDMAEAITLSGQLSIRWIIGHLNDFLNKTIGTTGVDYVVASDTDSVYLTLAGLVEKFITTDCRTDKKKIVDFLDKSASKIIKPFIDKKFDQLAKTMNAYDNKMIMERECIADKGIWTAKKRYMLNVHDSEGVRYEIPKMKIMGIETTRSSTPQVVRDQLKKAIKIILTGSEDQLIDLVNDFKQKFFRLSIDEIAFPRSCNNISQYEDKTTIWRKSTPIAVKGALVYNHFIREMKLDQKYNKIQEGDKIKFVSLRDQNPFGCNVISFPSTAPKEFELDRYVDYHKQFQTSFLDPLSVILSHIGWHYERKAVLF